MSEDEIKEAIWSIDFTADRPFRAALLRYHPDEDCLYVVRTLGALPQEGP